jgi:hypothetical protein
VVSEARWLTGRCQARGGDVRGGVRRAAESDIEGGAAWCLTCVGRRALGRR